MKRLLFNIILLYRYTTGKVKHYYSGDNKSRVTIFLELLSWLFREREFNKLYYAAGLNLKEKKQDAFIGRKTFLEIKRNVEKRLKQKAGCAGLTYDILTKDKFCANSLMKANGIPSIDNAALLRSNHMILPGGYREPLSFLTTMNGRKIIKNHVLEAGDGVMVLDIEAGQIRVNEKPVTQEFFRTILADGVWILQDYTDSHREIRKINATALNTTRIVTILDGEKPVYLTGFQSFATGDAPTDSWSKGSVYVGIDTGRACLKEYGFFNFDLKGKTRATTHPDSKVVFKDYPLPYLKEAVELCLRAHELFYFHFIIGWDVAITDAGPHIVEANEKPGINAVQIIDGGLRDAIRKNADKYLKH